MWILLYLTSLGVIHGQLYHSSIHPSSGVSSLDWNMELLMELKMEWNGKWNGMVNIPGAQLQITRVIT